MVTIDLCRCRCHEDPSLKCKRTVTCCYTCLNCNLKVTVPLYMHKEQCDKYQEMYAELSPNVKINE